MGIVTKTVSGKKYLYQWHYEDGRKKEIYCGVASENSSKAQANKLELKRLHSEKKSLETDILNAEKQMKKYAEKAE